MVDTNTECHMKAEHGVNTTQRTGSPRVSGRECYVTPALEKARRQGRNRPCWRAKPEHLAALRASAIRVSGRWWVLDSPIVDKVCAAGCRSVEN